MHTGPLTDPQRELVHHNLHLVRRHLHRYVRRSRRPTREREIEDLYQEGCLGLIQAARTFDPASGIPFEAYAFRRIHHEVSRALHERFATICIPIHRRRCKSADPNAPPQPAVQNLESDPVDDRSRSPSDPDREAASAEIFRRQFESAINRVRRVSNRRGRPDRAELVDALITHRLLIPDEGYKTPLRQIARDTRSSYGRVAACEKDLLSRIRVILQEDGYDAEP